MDNIENCADCGKRFGFTERIFSKTNGLWICEDCAIKQLQENDNKDQKIADLEAKLAKNRKWLASNDGFLENQKLKQQLAQHEKHNAWVLEFLEKYQIDTELTPEYSENPIIEYCEQVEDFRAVDNKIIEDLQKELAEKDKNALALFSALYDILEEQDPENVSSRIDYLTKQNNGAISDFYKEHKVLKQELEEKETRIAELEEILERTTWSWNDELNKNGKSNQDKISFAVAELDKLRQSFIYNYNSEIECIDPYDNNCCLSLSTTLYNTTIDIFDNQIKAIKGEK